MCQLLNPFDLLTFPCLIQLPPLKVLMLVGAVMAGKWSVAGLSVLAHMHTPPTDPFTSRGQEGNESILPFVFHPHAGIVVLFSSCIGWGSPLSSSCRELGEAVSVIHDFVHVNDPFMFGLCIHVASMLRSGCCFPHDFVCCGFV